MADHGHDLLFGTFLTPAADQPAEVVALARLTEQVGLHLVTVQDHPYQAKFLDTWTLLSVIAARTVTLRVAPNVANLPLRLPAVLARSVASLDLLSDGRVELGLGAGAFWDAIAANGGARLTPAESVRALEEGIAIIRAMWAVDGGSVRVDGRHHRVWGAHSGPAPAHDVGIWLGAYKERMLAMTGRLADGWLPSSPHAAPDALPAMNAVIDEAAVSAGRQPSEVRRLYNIAGTFSERGSGFLQGPTGTWAEQLAELTLTQGMSAYLLMTDDAEVIRRLAAEVAPAVREIVAAERGAVSGAVRPGAAGGSAEVPTERPVATRAKRRADTPGSTGRGVAQSALQTVPTPDDGTRRSDVRVWDESARPTGPAPDPGRTYTAHEQATGRHLIDVHDNLRAELQQLHDLLDQVTAGTMDAGAARDHINAMTMRQNNWTLGAYCESYCRIVTVHHTIEDQSMFRHLRRADHRLRPVIDRLQEEHGIIHDVLDSVDRALVSFVSGPDGVKELRAAVDLLTDALLSHLSYEERELVEPLSRLGLY